MQVSRLSNTSRELELSMCELSLGFEGEDPSPGTAMLAALVCRPQSTEALKIPKGYMITCRLGEGSTSKVFGVVSRKDRKVTFLSFRRSSDGHPVVCHETVSCKRRL